jgi:hypothetical protein
MMSVHSSEVLSHYACPGIMTDPKEHTALFAGLPRNVGDLVRVVQGLMIHVFWAKAYGVTLTDEQQQTLQVRDARAKLTRLVAADPRPLSVARPPEQRQVGNCRDFSTLLCAMLRHQGVPARARCGFGMYFMPNHGEDHWVVEYWKADENRWVMVDSQLDELQRDKLQTDFDTLDMPAGRFLPGGKAWQLCRAGQADPDSFGIFDMHGMGFIGGDMIRDLLALNKIELLPWDVWGLMAKREDEITADDMALLDRIAEVTLLDADPSRLVESYCEARALYEQNPILHMPAEWAPE